MRKENLIISLDRQTLRKAEISASLRGCSISVLLADQIESLVEEDEAYQSAERRALALLDDGFHLGYTIPASRDR
jgi:hypothetical protein